MAIELINRLIQDLNTSNISYCHWKSNYSLAESLAGGLDIDLLVDRRSLSQAAALITNLGFKQASIRFGEDAPGIYHYYGNDSQTGQLIHLHLFSSVLTGESFIKSHLFPFEQMAFENTETIEQIKTISRSAELVLFILRTFIKYGSLLDTFYLIGKAEEIKGELNWLLSGGDMNASLSLLKKYCPVIEENLFLTCIDTLQAKGPWLRRLLLAYRVRSRLRVYAIDTPFKRISVYLQLFWEQVRRSLGGKKKNKMPSSGGFVIAFVGPEATGKSTLVSETKKWLGQAFAARTIHAGKPPSTWITAPINILLPLVRQLWPQMRTSRLEGHVSQLDLEDAPVKTKGLSGLIYALRSVSLAWDRRQLLVQARRLAASGEIIVSDRYPSENVGTMDSPRLQENVSEKSLSSQLFNWLARLEHRLYRQIPPPDLVLILKVSVETARQRNRDRIKVGKETDEYLESRHRQARQWIMAGTKYIHEIDTEQSLAETISCVKKTIWESI